LIYALVLQALDSSEQDRGVQTAAANEGARTQACYRDYKSRSNFSLRCARRADRMQLLWAYVWRGGNPALTRDSPTDQISRGPQPHERGTLRNERFVNWPTCSRTATTWARYTSEQVRGNFYYSYLQWAMKKLRRTEGRCTCASSSVYSKDCSNGLSNKRACLLSRQR
jgi:hypothetical protein